MSDKFPKATNVDGSATTIPAFFKPTNAIKSPIPALTACFISFGIAFITSSLIPVTDIIKNIIPDNKVAEIAVCHGIPIPIQTPNPKNALSPIPGAKTIGNFAIAPIIKVPTALAIAVAANTLSFGIPT